MPRETTQDSGLNKDLIEKVFLVFAFLCFFFLDVLINIGAWKNVSVKIQRGVSKMVGILK